MQLSGRGTRSPEPGMLWGPVTVRHRSYTFSYPLTLAIHLCLPAPVSPSRLRPSVPVCRFAVHVYSSPSMHLRPRLPCLASQQRDKTGRREFRRDALLQFSTTRTHRGKLAFGHGRQPRHRCGQGFRGTSIKEEPIVPMNQEHIAGTDRSGKQ